MTDNIYVALVLGALAVYGLVRRYLAYDKYIRSEVTNRHEARKVRTMRTRL